MIKSDITGGVVASCPHVKARGRRIKEHSCAREDVAVVANVATITSAFGLGDQQQVMFAVDMLRSLVQPNRVAMF